MTDDLWAIRADDELIDRLARGQLPVSDSDIEMRLILWLYLWAYNCRGGISK